MSLDVPPAPEIFVRSFKWWAAGVCTNQQFDTAECGALIPKFTGEYLSESAKNLIEQQCADFWLKAESVIRSANGRCNWHPSVDTEENHIHSIGSCFFYARHGDTFFMEQWPEKERNEFVEMAKTFPPMVLTEINGQLEYKEEKLHL